MSLKNPNSLVVVGVVVALLAGTVLLAGYTSIIPAGSDSGPQVKACQAAGGKSCSGAGPNVTACAKVSGAEQVATGCCAEEGKSCCAKSCTEGCTKPCCAEEGKSGCSGGPEAEAQ